jgi:hypothetical protein
MRRTPIDSTSLKSVGYAAKTHTLEVEFQSGRIYRYFEVPPRRYRALLDAESAGRFFNREIRGVYPSVLVSA